MSDSRVTVAVTDDGPGVSDEDLHHLFDRYYRSSATAATAGPQGSGLGLTVCARLVEAMGGSIRADRSPQGGLAVSFSLLTSPE
jgi:signal transduction histidine kinase